MTKEQRHEIIMETLIRQGSVLVSDLVEMLEVSAVTVRKDLTELERGDRLYRSHGKAVLINPYINNRSVNEKEKLATDEKHAIGREAARLITRDDSIVIASIDDHRLVFGIIWHPAFVHDITSFIIFGRKVNTFF